MACAESAPRRRMPRAEREEQMLEVARRVFAQVGYEAASMDAIAEQVGVTKPMLYSYFGSKDGLYLACVARAQRDLADAIRAAVDEPGRSVEERLWHGTVAYFDFVEEHREAWNLFYPESSAVTERFRHEIREERLQLADLLVSIFIDTASEQGVDPEVARIAGPMAHAFVGAAMAIAGWWTEHPEEPKDLQALRLMNFAWIGLGSLLRGELWEPPVG